MAHTYRYTWIVRHGNGTAAAEKRVGFTNIDDALWYVSHTLPTANTLRIERIQTPYDMRVGNERRQMKGGA